MPWAHWRTHGDTIWEKELPWLVRLTTWPEYEVDSGRRMLVGRTVYRESMQEALAHRWPGIDFELPGVTAADVEAVLAERTITAGNWRDPTS